MATAEQHPDAIQIAPRPYRGPCGASRLSRDWALLALRFPNPWRAGFGRVGAERLWLRCADSRSADRSDALEIHCFMALLAALVIGIFIAYTLLHYILFLLASRPRNASDIGHELNEFERRQLVEWVPKAVDFLKHDDEHRTYDDVFGSYRSELDHYCTCVFPRTIFSHAYMADD